MSRPGSRTFKVVRSPQEYGKTVFSGIAREAAVCKLVFNIALDFALERVRAREHRVGTNGHGSGDGLGRFRGVQGDPILMTAVPVAQPKLLATQIKAAKVRRSRWRFHIRKVAVQNCARKTVLR